MDENNNGAPDGLDDFLTDQDPQSARASQGFNQIAKSQLDSGPVTSDSIEPEASPIDYAVSGAAGKLGEGAEGILGNEIGAIGPNIKSGMGDAATALGEIAPMAAYPDKEGAARQFLSKAQEAFKNGTASNKDVSYALQAFKSAQRVNQRNNMADGGQVSLDIALPQDHGHSIPTGDNTWEEGNLNGYADGGDVTTNGAEPQGLDSFLGGTPQGTQMPAMPQSAPVQVPNDGTPAGLNDFIAPEQQEAQFGTPIEQGKAALEGAAQGVAGPLATGAELMMGVKAADMRAREEANPYTSMAGKIAGLGGSMLTGVGEGRLALATGEAAANLVKGAGIASKIGAAAADGAIQNMLVTGGDEITKAMREDPDSSMQGAISTVGLSGLLGGSLSGALGTINPLWKATFGNKGDQIIADFNGRMAEHMTGVDPAQSVAKELGDHWTSTNAIADPVYGANGLKSQQIAAAMPEFHQGMVDQAKSLTDSLGSTIDKMNAKPNSFPSRLTDKLSDLKTELDTSLSKAQSPGDIFNALQDAKQNLQGYAKFDKFVTPVDEGHGFVQAAKSLQRDFRTSLEDQGTWGAAGKAQQDINSAASDFFGASKDFQSKFTTKVGGDPIVDPGKVNTYINQLGKPNAEIKSAVLKNYLDASDKYRSKINDIYQNLGVDSPVTTSSLNSTMQTFNKPTTGQKLADILVEKGLQSAGGKGVGAAIGAYAGSKVAIPGGELLGGLIGSHVLGPFISSVMPLIAKPLMESASNAAGLRASAQAGYAMSRGQSLMSKATSNLFQAGKDILPASLIPKPDKLAKLDKMVAATNTNPASTTSGISNIAHYLPQHSAAASNVVGKATNYLASIRPSTDKKSPLDGSPPPSSTAMANYNRQLANAEQPLLLLKHIKEGTLTSKDLLTVQTIYPDLYKSLALKIMDNMTDHLTKGKTIPYQTRIGLSKFAAQPLDSTMIPNSIMAAQPQQPMPQPPGEQPGKGKARKGAGGTALNKLSSSYQTASQALASRHEKSDD